jgi:hypothetical protein
MNGASSQGKWQALEGRMTPCWGKLPQEIATEIDELREKILAELQERYGFTQEQAEHVLDEFLIKRR